MVLMEKLENYVDMASYRWIKFPGSDHKKCSVLKAKVFLP